MKGKTDKDLKSECSQLRETSLSILSGVLTIPSTHQLYNNNDDGDDQENLTPTCLKGVVVNKGFS